MDKQTRRRGHGGGVTVQQSNGRRRRWRRQLRRGFKRDARLPHASLFGIHAGPHGPPVVGVLLAHGVPERPPSVGCPVPGARRPSPHGHHAATRTTKLKAVAWVPNAAAGQKGLDLLALARGRPAGRRWRGRPWDRGRGWQLSPRPPRQGNKEPSLATPLVTELAPRVGTIPLVAVLVVMQDTVAGDVGETAGTQGGEVGAAWGIGGVKQRCAHEPVVADPHAHLGAMAPAVLRVPGAAGRDNALGTVTGHSGTRALDRVEEPGFPSPLARQHAVSIGADPVVLDDLGRLPLPGDDSAARVAQTARVWAVYPPSRCKKSPARAHVDPDPGTLFGLLAPIVPRGTGQQLIIGIDDYSSCGEHALGREREVLQGERKDLFRGKDELTHALHGDRPTGGQGLAQVVETGDEKLLPPAPPRLQVVAQEHPGDGPGAELGKGNLLQVNGARQEVQQGAERDKVTLEVPSPVALVPRRVAVHHLGVLREAPVATRERPPLLREPGVL